MIGPDRVNPSAPTSVKSQKRHWMPTASSRHGLSKTPTKRRTRRVAATPTGQLFELVQNGADALAGSSGGHILIRLTPKHLYCADDGEPIDSDGVRALMFSRLSPKRETDEIGRFGLGFKSVLGVTDTPEFFSRSGSFRFNRASAKQAIQPIAPDIERYPVLRLPEAIAPWPRTKTDLILRELMSWAVNIVRLPLKPEAHEKLAQQISNFPAQFLLFVEQHVSELVLQDDDQEEPRTFSLRREADHYLLDNGVSTTRWMLIKDMHRLSPDARGDSRSLDDAREVPITWAAPVLRLREPGQFWAFFPTLTTSLLSGILNAPWKTNEDRQNLLPGGYNDELIDAAAGMVADALPRLSTEDDPARHLDALPRRYEAGDSEHSNRLRDQLNASLWEREFVPDQGGKLRRIDELSFGPLDRHSEHQKALDRWAAYENRPSGWLHHRALITERLAVLNRVYSVRGSQQIPRASIAEWLGALVKGAKQRQESESAVQASMAAIQTAALISASMRRQNDLGNIVLTADERWVKPERDAIWLGGGHIYTESTLVHPQLEADPKTLRALKELGLRTASQEVVFRNIASTLLDGASIGSQEREYPDDWRKFWKLARGISHETVLKIIRENDFWRDTLRVRTMAGVGSLCLRLYFQVLSCQRTEAETAMSL